MLNYIKNDILKVTNGLLVHGVNCQGAMGAGVAGAIRRKFPEVYTAFCAMKTGKHLLGQFAPVLIKEDYTEADNFYIGNCYTQVSMGSDGKRYASPEAIEESLTKAYKFAIQNDLEVLSLPKIGAGLGGLDWDTEVEPIVRKLSNKYDSIITNVYYID